jgi:uncharacterized phage protein (predicted DNA packaging)
MSAVTLELTKAHMKIDGNAEDELIQLYIDAAERWIWNYIGAELNPVPADLKLAILRLVSFHFECRNLVSFGVSMQLAPQGVAAIADSYREKWFTDGE